MSLDRTCAEIEAYKELKGVWVTYGDYVNIIRPGLTTEERNILAEIAERQDKNRRDKYGTADKIHQHREFALASAESED